jgi:cytochrome P450
VTTAVASTHAPHYPGLPLLGSLLEARKNPLEMFERASKLGDLVELSFPQQRAFLVNHPDHVDRVLHGNIKAYAKQTRGYAALRRILGTGLLTSEGSFWLRQRRLAQPAFHRERIAAFGASMVRATQEMIAAWQPWLESGQSFDLHNEMMKLTLKVVGQTLLSADVTGASAEIGDALTRLLRVISRTTTQIFELPDWVPTADHRELHSARAALDAVVHRIIADRRARGAGDDLLGLFMSTQDADTGESMTDEQLRDEVMTMLLAGHETTANALTWGLWLLAKAPEVEQKLRVELAHALEGRVASTAIIPSLKYTLGVVNESLRLYPPAWILARRAVEDDTLGSVQIPNQALIFISPWLIHRRADFWPQPEAFSPERWLGSDGHAPVSNKNAWLPFSTGQRKCIGDTFALLEMQLVLATVLQRVRITIEADREVVPEPVFTLRPRNGLWVTARNLKG